MSVAIESSKSVCCDREVQKINKVYELWANDDDGNDGIELIFSIVRHRRCRCRQSNVASSYFYAQQILCSCHLSQWNTRGIWNSFEFNAANHGLFFVYDIPPPLFCTANGRFIDVVFDVLFIPNAPFAHWHCKHKTQKHRQTGIFGWLFSCLYKPYTEQQPLTSNINPPFRERIVSYAIRYNCYRMMALNRYYGMNCVDMFF